MRWLIVTDDFPPLEGGVATWASVVAGALHDAGDQVTVLARARDGLGADAEGHPMPYEVVGVPGPSFGRRGGLWTALKAEGYLRRVDRVLATTWPVATWLSGRCARVGVELQVAFHGSDLTRPIAARREEALRRVCGIASRRWVVSRFLGGSLEARDFGVDVLPAPVDVGPPRRAETLGRLVFVGRATGLKGGDRFVRIVAASGLPGTVIGDGPELESWKQLAAECGAEVTFTGRLSRHRVLAELGQHDLLLLLPRYDADGSGGEGFGLALVEAAALGVAVAGCDTGGVLEALGPGLVLSDPDHARACWERLSGWWNPSRGDACRRWVAANHGTARVVSALRG